MMQSITPIISIHAPREESDYQLSNNNAYTGISIHAPREESDPELEGGEPDVDISIHAPREESDGQPFVAPASDFYFNPRSP